MVSSWPTTTLCSPSSRERASDATPIAMSSVFLSQSVAELRGAQQFSRRGLFVTCQPVEREQRIRSHRAAVAAATARRQSRTADRIGETERLGDLVVGELREIAHRRAAGVAAP